MVPAGDTFLLESIGRDQLTIATQLMQAIDTMHRPDEMFRWLASIIIQRFDVAIVQFWTCESKWTGQPSAQLQAMARQDASLPTQLVANEKVATIVEQLSRAQRMSPPLAVEQVFSQYQASLLKRYGFGYCAYSSVGRNVRLASAGYALAQERTSTGLIFVELLFLRTYPRRDLIPTLGLILEQAVVVAENHRLLLPVAASTGRLPTSQDQQSFRQVSTPSQIVTSASRSSVPQGTPAQEWLSALPDLLPRLKQDARLLVSSSPFASSATISDKQALRLYAAIDGYKTVADLCSSTGMTLREAYVALQTLLSLQRIDLYTLDGRPVDVALLFKNR